MLFCDVGVFPRVVRESFFKKIEFAAWAVITRSLGVKSCSSPKSGGGAMLSAPCGASPSNWRSNKVSRAVCSLVFCLLV